MGLTRKIFDLVAMLSKGEKLNYKKYASRHTVHSNNNYIKLFDVINQQVKTNCFNEAEIAGKFEGERMVNNFAEIKSYLYESILRSLSGTQTDKISTLINYSLILSAKNLHGQAKELLMKAKRKAIKSESIYLMPRILNIEYYHILQFESGKHLDEKLSALHKEETENIEKINNLNKYKYYSGRIVSFRSENGWVRGEKEMQELELLINDDIFSSREKALTSMARFLYFQTKATYSYYKSDHKNTYKYLQEQLDLMESALPERDPINYSMVLQNYMYVSVMLLKFDKIDKYLKLFERLINEPKLTNRSRSRLYSAYYLIKLYVMQFLPETDENSEVTKKAEDWLKENFDQGLTNNSYYLSLDISSRHIYTEQYDKALYWINRILNDKNAINRMEVFIPAKILGMIIHYELNNYDYLENSIKSTYRFLLNKNKIYKFEKILLKFIKALAGLGITGEFISLLKNFKEELEMIQKDTYERQAFEYFDYISWIDSKIRGKSVLEIKKEAAV